VFSVVSIIVFLCVLQDFSQLQNTPNTRENTPPFSF
jgi:hypothetical protein